jgi:hypothetical protein
MPWLPLKWVARWHQAQVNFLDFTFDLVYFAADHGLQG